MRFDHLKTLKTAALAVTILLLTACVSWAQDDPTYNLTAAETTIALPDGRSVPMWGYACTALAAANTCPVRLSKNAAGWSPILLTATPNSTLTINLTNNLPDGVPTSLVIVGELGGGLGSSAHAVAGPDHTNAQAATTWPIAGGTGTTPPTQGPRVQSFSTEAAHNAMVTLTWTNLKAGTYLIESGTHPSIQGPMGLYGMLVVTTPPSGATAGTAYTGVPYNADLPLLFSEIDPVQNGAVSLAVHTAGFSETMVWSGAPGGCGDPTPGNLNFGKCYPPAVNYTPYYYMINGTAFSKTNVPASVFAAAAGTTAAGPVTTGITGSVLVRLVNAGLRMHVPSIVGSVTRDGSNLPGFSLIAEDGNALPGVPRVQSEVFMAAGKTYDVSINAPASVGTALPIYDRELSLSGNATARDAGMLAYISINGSAGPGIAAAMAVADTYNSVVAGQTLTVSDPGKGVIANDVNVYGVKVITPPTKGTLTLNVDGTFTYVANANWSGGDTFTYCGNGTISGAACASVTLNPSPVETGSGITLSAKTFTSNLATYLSVAPPGILTGDKDGAGYPLTVSLADIVPASGLTVTAQPNGGFIATVNAAGTYTFTYKAKNSQGTVSASSQTVTVIFATPSNLAVTVLDGNDKKTVITDYRWIIEEDRTFYVDPTKTTNTGGNTGATVVPTFGTNFHTSYMPVIAQGCTGPLSCESGQTVVDPATGAHNPAVCDVGNGVCRTTGTQLQAVMPVSVHLDPTKRYYISILPGDAANPFIGGNGSAPANCAAGPGSLAGGLNTDCGHGMGGAPIGFGQTAVTVYSQPSPYPPAKLSVFVFQDDFPLNGEQDGGGGIDVLSPNEPGLGGFQITLFDDAGGTGDATGQPTYDMFNMPLTNSLAGTIDPTTGLNACPVDGLSGMGPQVDPLVGGDGVKGTQGITGMIVTCPKYEADGKTLSPLAGQAVVANLYPGRYGVVATPGADRIARGEEWLQTNTLDGQKAHDSFLRIGEPSFFQEFGPAGYHVSIGFANPAIINGRKPAVCTNTDPNVDPVTNCHNTVTGHVTTERMSRTPDERLYGSGSYDSFSFTQCYVSFGDPDGEDFAFTKCAADGSFTLSGLPDGNWRITVFDQWNDMLVDGLSTPVRLGSATNGQCPGSTSNASTCDMGEIAMNQWQANIITQTFFDQDGNGVRGPNEPGLALVPTNIRFRDGSFSNFNNTDLNGNAGFNEIFPLFSWYVIETDSTRYKNTGTHVVYDAGGPADGSANCGNGNNGNAPCGSAGGFQFMANTNELVPLPSGLHVPGARYCNSADCPTGDSAGGSTGRVDPAWVVSEGWQGFSGQNSFIEFGKAPFQTGENGGIRGHVIYASTRPFDDPQLLLQTSWEPLVPGVTINLYQEGTAPDGSKSLTLVDTTKTSSWDDWSQGFRSDGIPNMNCPGQGRDTGAAADLFFFTLFNQPMFLDSYSNGGAPAHTLPNNSQFKCYDGMHNWNQVQPAPYDGMYQFPSIVGRNPSTGVPTGTGIAVNPAGGSVAGTNCTVCTANPVDGTPMLPVGKYVVEIVVPQGYELVKEEDKNILIGDNYIAPVTQQFGGLSNIFILPDQAAIGSAYNKNNPQNSTTDLGAFPRHEGDTGSVESFWPCVGQARIVPDYISLFPGSQEVAPFAGAMRNLCDRKEVILEDQSSVLAKFYVFTSTHVAAHFTGIITDDFTSEFDPFSPTFGEKFSPANMPISIKDWTGTEISRVYSDQWGAYNGLTYSTWEVNPPNPTGYAPTMMVTCMNDPGTGSTPDPLFNPQYSQFCYEIPFMPGQTQYMDTPVVPTSAFADAGYNNPDCSYPDGTPGIKEVDGDGIGPWVANVAGSVTSVTITTAGSGYTSTPSVTFGAAPAGGTTATGTAVMTVSGSVAGVTLTPLIGGGLGYATSQNGAAVTFSLPPSGTRATGTMTVSGGRVTSVTITNGGSGYTSAPSVTFPAPTGTGIHITASGTALLGESVSGVNITNAGSGYTTAPSVTFGTPPAGGVRAQGTSAITTVGGKLTIMALGDQVVPNNGYSGPSYSRAPFNQKTVTRHYGFGGTQGSVTIGGKTATINSWSDSQIVVTVPGGVPACVVQQQAQYGGSAALCGQLVVIAGNGKQSIDTVTVTVGGKAPKHIAASDSLQAAIDAANPGDLLMVDPNCAVNGVASSCQTAGATVQGAAGHNEMLLMWKPVRLQGVGAVSSVINANTHPAGKMDGWRRQVNCLFGLALNGAPSTGNVQFDQGGNVVAGSGGANPYDPTGTFNCPANMQFQVDRLPLEAAVGWDATLNGNLAELLQEPSLMGALEGAAITVLSKGVVFPAGSNPWTDGNEGGAFPTGTRFLNNSSDCANNGHNPYPSNFRCNPSSIDGLSITNSSQGGGGIFVHGWGHYIQIANNRVSNNSGTLSGGINVGQGEFAPANIRNGTTPNADPGSCNLTATGGNLNIPTGAQEPYCYNLNVNMHNNSVTLNSSTGDELFSATPAGAGGVSICNGADYYKFNFNWVCGNLSTGDGGGIAHIGFSYNGDIEHNTIIFNQSTNPTISTNGGGLLAMGAPDVDTTCGATVDLDCLDPAATVTPSDGVGPNLTINANLIMGNAAESGSGGGLRLQNVNGSDVLAFPNTPANWFAVSVTNNIIANNVAGWDGGGISLLDALNVNIINNTLVSNDSTASAGVLFNTLGAPLASASGPTCTSNCGVTSKPQPAGLVAVQNSAVLAANIAALPATGRNRVRYTCPNGHFQSGHGPTNGTCGNFSYPLLQNNVIWQNRSFFIGVGSLGTGTQNQQNVVSLYNASFSGGAASPAASQTSTGACPAASYWEIGVRGDTGPSNHGSGVTLAPTYSILTDGVSDYGPTGTTHNLASNPQFISQYCNGSRVPPELGASGYQVPPGISDATVPNPIFNLTPAATVDEGNNWINISWGPLSQTNSSVTAGSGGYGQMLGNYSPQGNSPVNNAGNSGNGAPTTDFFGANRSGNPDIGAVELFPNVGGFSLSPTALNFGSVEVNTTVTLSVAVSNTGNTNITVTTSTAAPFSVVAASSTCPTSPAQLPVGGSCSLTVAYSPTTATAANSFLCVNGTLTGGACTGAGVQAVTLSGTGVSAATTTVSGTISGAGGNGALVTLTQGAETIATVNANAAGSYSFASVLSSGTPYFVTPSKAGFSFSPPTQSVTVSGSPVAGVNFTSAAAGVAIDTRSAPTNRNSGPTAISVSGFSTTGPHELLLAFVATDSTSAASPNSVTSMSNTGTALTWSLVVRTNAQGGTSEIWAAAAPTTVSGITITANLAQGTAGSLMVISFKSLSNPNVGPTIFSMAGANGTNGRPFATLNALPANSMVIGVGNDYSNAVAVTAPAGQTLENSFDSSTGDTYWVQRLTNDTTAPSASIFDTLASTDHWNLSVVAVQP